MYARQESPGPRGAFVLFLHFFSVWVDRGEAAGCQVAHRGCSVLALKKTTDTPEVYWLGILQSFVCLFFVSGACIATSLKKKSLPRTDSFIVEPRRRSCLDRIDGWLHEGLMRRGRWAGRVADVSTFFLRHTMFIKPRNSQSSWGQNVVEQLRRSLQSSDSNSRHVQSAPWLQKYPAAECATSHDFCALYPSVPLLCTHRSSCLLMVSPLPFCARLRLFSHTPSRFN